jgi:non-heme chloroperoxidase
MRAGPAGCVVVSAIVGVALLVARTLAAKIARNPDPFQRERLAREPDGAEVGIARPDGTVLRALVAGEGPTAVLAHGYGGSVAACCPVRRYPALPDNDCLSFVSDDSRARAMRNM